MTTTEVIEAGREWGKPLTADDARELTAQIRMSVQELLPLIRTAYRRRADLALGYGGWDEYCDAELAGLRLALDDRLKAVAELRSDGMSQRAIGSALGISAATVNRALATVSDETVPDRVTGTDGKDRPATRPAPKSTPTPGSADAAVRPPVDPGATPAPACSMPPDPQEPDPAEVLRVLADAGVDGWTVADLGECLPGVVYHSDLRAVVIELSNAGEVCQVGRTENGAIRWALPVAGMQYKEDPAERIAAVAEAAPEYVKPVEPEQIEIVKAARGHAKTIVSTVDEEVRAIIRGIDLGERGLVTEQMIADLRAAVDLLASRLEVPA